MAEWQPIETAPMDGTAILLNTAEDIVVAAWEGPGVSEFHHEDAYTDGWYVDSGRRHIHCLRGPSPTHWMPLPEPPHD